MGMRYSLLMIALVGCEVRKEEASEPQDKGGSEPTKDVPISFKFGPVVGKALREELNVSGELLESDLKKVTHLRLNGLKITDTGLKEMAKLTQLEELWLNDTQVTKAGVAQLQNALPNCEIEHNAKE